MDGDGDDDECDFFIYFIIIRFGRDKGVGSWDCYLFFFSLLLFKCSLIVLVELDFVSNFSPSVLCAILR